MYKFPERLTEALEKKNISPAELARRIGVNDGTISNYKKGRYAPKDKRVEDIAKALNISIAWLMGADVQMGVFSETKEPAEADPRIEMIYNLIKNMSDENLMKLLDYARYLIAQQSQ